ncbi:MULTISPECIES: hypothetical protein [Streptomycetaceae]|uniref:Uncharacterized protein n=1 Tax=Streptantibioticus cattleyicolor (strain ATCC 35852 / DSM 46488 / JCM 4925 / NBRC 14057 / NRRL 8057) TaxID=1003195 RepID=F8JRY5_STREN|nr:MULTISPECIES: hypothetical protein [Streptomycetaceae]AEW92896.1 hypothetical protein SCATT_05250 [Streptantibioticus cattleyicolor NRRL 8057 = DSM 46488]MYS57646.1 hypothetical protein [Streptomyces sp. SID5468]CCB73252.1 protein of unknown function [Streptantibioticus cattleyicolor NRRL 8057 = DSM 46488]
MDTPTSDQVPTAPPGDDRAFDPYTLFGTQAPDVVSIPEADAAGSQLLIGTAHVLAGLMVLGLLEHAGSAVGLVDVLYPTAQGDERDRALFLAGAITGQAVELRRNRRTGGWTTEDLNAAIADCEAAGFVAMGRLMARASKVFGNRPETG